MRPDLQSLANVRSRLRSELLNYFRKVADAARAIPPFYPIHLQDPEPGRHFDEIRRTLRPIPNPQTIPGRASEEISDVKRTAHKRQLNEGASRTIEAHRSSPFAWSEQARAIFPRAVILGDAGIGKTWLLRQEAWRVAVGSAANLESGASTVEKLEIPLLAYLPDLNRTRGPLERVLIDTLSTDNSLFLKSFITQQLHSGHCTVLLDGWDEVGRRDLLRRRLQEFVEQMPNTRILLTSRLVGYGGAPFSGASELELLPLSIDDQDIFVRAWFDADETRARAVIRELKADSEIRTLAGTPLMLALLCRAWASKGNARRRGELYDVCLSGLMRDWRQTKGATTRDVMIESMMRRLAVAAQRLFSGQRERFTETELAEALGFDLDNERQSALAQKFIEGRKAEGVLVAADGAEKEWRFLHRGFHEYLAARSLAHSATTGGWRKILRLVDRIAWSPRWHEVIILLSGLLYDAVPLLESLADTSKDDYLRHRLALAARCAHEAHRIALAPPDVGHARDQSQPDASTFRQLSDRITSQSFALHREHAGKHTLDAIGHFQRGMVGLARISGLIDGRPVSHWIKTVVEENEFYSFPLLATLLNATGNQRAVRDFLEHVLLVVRGLRDREWDEAYDISSDLAQSVSVLSASEESEAFLEALLPLIEGGNGNGDMAVEWLIAAVAPMSATEGFCASLAHLLVSENLKIRERAVKAVAGLGSRCPPCFFAYLADCLAGEHAATQSDAVKEVLDLRRQYAWYRTGKLSERIQEQLEQLKDSFSSTVSTTVNILAGVSTFYPLSIEQPPAVIFPEWFLNRLADMLASPDQQVRKAVVSATWGWGEGVASRRFIERIQGLLADENLEIRAGAAEVSGSLGRGAVTPHFLVCVSKLLRSNDSEMVESGLQALMHSGRTGGSLAATSEILSLLAAKWGEGHHAGSAIRDFGAVAAIPEIVEVLKKQLNESKREALGVLWGIGERAAESPVLDLLKGLLSDSDEYVRAEAIAVLPRIGKLHATFVTGLASRVHDVSSKVRSSVADSIGELGPALPPMVLLKIPGLLDDPDKYVRMAAARAAAKLASEGIVFSRSSLSAAAFSILQLPTRWPNEAKQLGMALAQPLPNTSRNRTKAKRRRT